MFIKNKHGVREVEQITVAHIDGYVYESNPFLMGYAEEKAANAAAPSVREYLGYSENSLYCEECDTLYEPDKLNIRVREQRWGESTSLHCPQGHWVANGAKTYNVGAGHHLARVTKSSPERDSTGARVGRRPMGGVGAAIVGDDNYD